MAGSVVKFEAPNGHIVNALHYEDRADLPAFDIEVVNRDGEVTEHFEILGHYALIYMAERKHWKQLH